MCHEGWRQTLLTDRERVMVQLAQFYEKQPTAEGLPAHGTMMLIAKLVRHMDDTERSSFNAER